MKFLPPGIFPLMDRQPLFKIAPFVFCSNFVKVKTASMQMAVRQCFFSKTQLRYTAFERLCWSY